MGRREVDQEIKQMLGGSGPLFERIPDEFIDAEWDLLKRLRFGETVIPNKYKELIGLAVAATSRCRYSTLWHSEMARVFGACDAEIQEAAFVAKLAAGWITYMNALDLDYEGFAEWVRSMASPSETGIACSRR